MSLESQIAALVTATTNLTDVVVGGKLEEIDATLAQGMLDLPSHMQKTLYVDNVYGNDNNAGTYAAPLKTIKKACLLAPEEGYLRIYLMADVSDIYVWGVQDEGNYCRADVLIVGINRTTKLAQQNKIRMTWTPDEDGNYGCNMFYVGDTTSYTVMLTSLDVEIDEEPPAVPLKSLTYRGLISGNSGSKRGIKIVNLANVNINNNSPTAKLIPNPEGIVMLAVAAVTHTGMSGLWAGGATAGTLPKDTGRILSNLASL